jgi:hypothetical protein
MQKLPFGFRLSAFTLMMALCLGSCWMNPDTQKPGEAALQGEWQQDSVPMQKQLLTYSLYHFRFSCDSFFVSIKTFSKVNYGTDSCMKSGHWVEYTRGNYGRRNDTLFLKGQFCNPDYTIKDKANCFRIGVYEEIFKINKITDSTIRLSSTSGVIPVDAHLIKRTTCHIKPL